MQRQQLHRTLIGIISSLALFATFTVLFTSSSYAQETLVCPTPEGGKPGSMQMGYCYLVTPTAAPVNGTNQVNSTGENSTANTTSNSTTKSTTNSTSNALPGNVGSLFSNLPVLNFLLPASQPASTNSTVSLSPLSSLLNGLGGGTSSGTSSNSSSSPATSPAANNSFSNQASSTIANGGAINGPGGSVCSADSFEEGDCKCPDYQELSYVCEDEYCSEDGGIDAGSIMSIVPGMPAGANCIFPAAAGTPKNEHLSCVMACNSKPVIYLYPTKTTSVDVQVAMQGHVTVSDPYYNLNGWQNVVAEPNGQLTYNGKKYQELYYESDTIKLAPPKTGMFISKANAKQELKAVGTKLGLNAAENDEFASYWSYRLKQLSTPYVFFSVFDESEKRKVDDVQISPKPDTFIGFLAYFKPVEKPYAVEPLQFPPVPARNGFTAVEWGGTVDE